MNKIDLLNSQTINLISELINILTLRRLILDVNSKIINQLFWSNQCQIYDLTLKDPTFEQLINILNHLPNLEKIVLNDCHISENNKISQLTSYEKLISLTLNNFQMSIGNLEFFLTFFPSLIYLKLHRESICSSDFVQHFSHWEYFISKNLPLLKKFHFYFCIPSKDNENLQLILSPFCTSFWVVLKSWFVTCIYELDDYYPMIILHSSTETFPHNLHNDRLSYSITTIKTDNPLKISNQWMARFQLYHATLIMENQIKWPNKNVFGDLTHLALDINGAQSSDEFHCLLSLINFSYINEIWLIENCGRDIQLETIKNLLDQSSNIRTLGLSSNDDFISRLEKICILISGRIDHLKIRLKQLHWIKLIVTSIKHVSNITIQYYDYSSYSISNMIKWLNQKGKKFFIDYKSKSIQIMMNKHDQHFSEVKNNHKRRKHTS